MASYTTPGVYVEETASFPPSVAEVSTAIPAFIGYTGKTSHNGSSLINTPVRITNFLEYKEVFGGPQTADLTYTLSSDGAALKPGAELPDRLLYHHVDFYFKNGGGACYVNSIGGYSTALKADDFTTALDVLAKEDEPTLYVFPDALLLGATYYTIVQSALAQCNDLGDRFTLVDMPSGSTPTQFRDGASSAYLRYGAAYTPYLETTLTHAWDDEKVQVESTEATVSNTASYQTDANGLEVSYIGLPEDSPQVSIDSHSAATSFAITGNHLTITLNNTSGGISTSGVLSKWGDFASNTDTAGFSLAQAGDGSTNVEAPLASQPLTFATTPPATVTMASLKDTKTAAYAEIETQLNGLRVTLPPSAGMAGIYAAVDRDRGVWKAPANVPVSAVLQPVSKITHDEQGKLNVDPDTGKSINAIRAFTGKGTLVWGARTLMGNSGDWRYISVRRLFNMVEESLKKATDFAVFEANDANTWLKVKGMCESFLFGLYEQGAFAGSEPAKAYYVNIGLGTTMTSQDVLEGRMIVEIGLAPVRPAEFIVLRFSQKIQE